MLSGTLENRRAADGLQPRTLPPSTQRFAPVEISHPFSSDTTACFGRLPTARFSGKSRKADITERAELQPVRHNYAIRLGMLVAAFVPLLGCARTDVPRANSLSTDARPTTASSREVPYAQAQAHLAAALYPRLSAADPNGNIFISPLSITEALGLALLGARGETDHQMRALLALDALTPAPSARDVIDTGDDAIEISLANALWIGRIAPVRSDYISSAHVQFGATPEDIDFKALSAADRINQWVARSTRDRITSIIEQVDPDTLAILANALYFKASWTKPFTAATQRPFRTPSGTSAAVPMMDVTDRFAYREKNGVQAISLAYGGNARFTMDIFLPRDPARLAALERNFDAASFFAGAPDGDRFALFAAGERTVHLVMPRFELRYKAGLNAALQSAGMTCAFVASCADFRRMTDARVKIDDVRHATYLKIDELGTEAAAVTTIGIVVTSAPIPPPDLVEMVVDRPFLLSIRDNKTGAILFFGRIADPAPVPTR
jgi:serpin B